MQACHSKASRYLGTTCTLRMLERFYWWIGMNVCTLWWLRHCLKCQARKTPRLTVRWPVISMPLPEGPGIAISVDYVGPLPVTPRGNTCILLITDRFRRRADMFPVTTAEFTAEGTANNSDQPMHSSMVVPTHHTLGQRPPVLLQVFTSCLPTFGSAQACHKFLSSKR